MKERAFGETPTILCFALVSQRKVWKFSRGMNQTLGMLQQEAVEVSIWSPNVVFSGYA